MTMKTQSQVSDVTIQISSKPVLTMPRSLSRQLGVRQGEQVSVQVRNGALRVRKNGQRKSSIRSRNEPRGRRVANILDWAGTIESKSGKTINVEEYTAHHGYEQFERPPRNRA
jgi:antitoxin component of MazEF toxin-antitoxin module